MAPDVRRDNAAATITVHSYRARPSDSSPTRFPFRRSFAWSFPSSSLTPMRPMRQSQYLLPVPAYSVFSAKPTTRRDLRAKTAMPSGLSPLSQSSVRLRSADCAPVPSVRLRSADCALHTPIPLLRGPSLSRVPLAPGIHKMTFTDLTLVNSFPLSSLAALHRTARLLG